MLAELDGNWFSRKKIDDDITLLWEPHVAPLIRCNIWHIKGRDRDLLIDTGIGVCSLKTAAEDLFAKNLLAVATHTHSDHIGGIHEFEHCAVHKDEVDGLHNPEDAILQKSDLSDEDVEYYLSLGYEIDPKGMLSAYPTNNFDINQFKIKPTKPSQILVDGDIIDIGNRHFEVMHLPGHSPGSIALYEESTATLFSGDVIYDGPLLTKGYGMDIDDYLTSMEKLRKLKVNVVHGGHDHSFGQEKFTQIIDHFIKKHNN